MSNSIEKQEAIKFPSRLAMQCNAKALRTQLRQCLYDLRQYSQDSTIEFIRKICRILHHPSLDRSQQTHKFFTRSQPLRLTMSTQHEFKTKFINRKYT